MRSRKGNKYSNYFTLILFCNVANSDFIILLCSNKSCSFNFGFYVLDKFKFLASFFNMNLTNAFVLPHNTSIVGSNLANVMLSVDWIIPVVVVLTSMAASLWLLFSLVHYGIKTKKWSRNPVYNSDNLNAGAVYSCVVSCAAVCFARSVFNVTFMIVGFRLGEDDLCDSVADIRFVLYALEIFFVQLFLWFRQRIFYSNQMLKVNYSGPIKGFSCAIIVLLFLVGMFTVVYNTIPDNHYSSPVHGCIYVPSEGQRPAFWISSAAVIVFGQMTLVALFVYALCQAPFIKGRDQKCSSVSMLKMKLNKSERFSAPNDSETIRLEHSSCGNRKMSLGTTRSRARPRGQTEKTIIQKTVIFAALSIAFDVFLLLFAQYAIPPSSHRRFSAMISDINTFLNLIFLIFSFIQYREMMTSPCSGIL